MFSEIYSIKIWGPKSEKEEIHFPTWNEIYKASIIEHDGYYRALTTMSVKTSNSFEQIERMEFYKFNLTMKYLNIYIDEENKRENTGSKDAENQQDDLKQQSAKQLAKARRDQQKAPKLPQFKTPK